MDAPGFDSPIRTYRQNLSKMRESNDPSDSEVTNLCSLGVVDLDLSLCPDVFGLKAFDEKMPITRMLPGSSPCELRLLLPDNNIRKDGFHDVVVENLIGSSTHVSPSDVIALRRRWPRAVFQVMKERCIELEDLRRQAFTGLQWAYQYAFPGYCPECKTRTAGSLDSHMMCCHLGLGQLWRCPVEWCAVWKGSVRECRDHFNDKHSGWDDIGDATLDPGLDFVASWSARIMEERSSAPPLIPLSPITAEDSLDSIVVQVGSPASELYTPAGLDWVRSVSRRRSRRPMKSATKCEKPAPAKDFLFRDILCAPAMGANRILTETSGNRDRVGVPRWRLARKGPFTNERSQASLRVLGKGCAFRHTTYSVEDHAPPEGGLGVPLNHPRFLEWISAPTSAWLLEMSPGQWYDTLSRDQAMTAAMQLHKDACLMNTNLDILDQYALALHGTASKILQQTIGGNPYPKAEVAATAQGPRARRESVHMEALGL